jgi:hypothetical protein
VRLDVSSLVFAAVVDGISRCIEALTRAGQYDPPLLQQAVKMFEVSPIKEGKITVSNFSTRTFYCSAIMSACTRRRCLWLVKGALSSAVVFAY